MTQTKRPDVFIQNIPVDEALTTYLKRLDLVVASETIATMEARGRVTARAVYAEVSSPTSNQAAMDGVAVRSVDTTTARLSAPLTLKAPHDFVPVNTGMTLPNGYDAVIMIEDIVPGDDDTILIHHPARPWQHVRPIGEDIVKTEMIVPSGHRLRPVDIAALLAGGVDTLEVATRPRVAILPTGDEIVQTREALVTGRIRDTNAPMLKHTLDEQGAVATIMPVVPDDPTALKDAVDQACRTFDMVLVLAGSSAGTKDWTASVLESLGEVVIHGTALRPGKPIVLAVVGRTPVIGVPGYPVSAYLATKTFVEPVLRAMIGEHAGVKPFVQAISATRLTSSVKSEEHVRVNVGYVDGGLIATATPRGAGVLMSLVHADGIAIIPRHVEGVERGDTLNVALLKPLDVIKQKLFAIGSHDLIMDILADLLPLTSAHVGSLGGLLALSRHQANLAPTHLLDPETGTYNVAAAARYFPHDMMALLKVVDRVQGLIVPPGNPKGITQVTDLGRPGLILANRQRGAGTRVLLDHLLNKAHMTGDTILGYDRALTTHMAVASAVATGAADVGVGVLSAANALGLDFVPIGHEAYDFLFYADSLNDPRMEALIATVKSQTFQDRVMALGGYGVSQSGTVITLSP